MRRRGPRHGSSFTPCPRHCKHNDRIYQTAMHPSPHRHLSRQPHHGASTDEGDHDVTWGRRGAVHVCACDAAALQSRVPYPTLLTRCAGPSLCSETAFMSRATPSCNTRAKCFLACPRLHPQLRRAPMQRSTRPLLDPTACIARYSTANGATNPFTHTCLLAPLAPGTLLANTRLLALASRLGHTDACCSVACCSVFTKHRLA